MEVLKKIVEEEMVSLILMMQLECLEEQHQLQDTERTGVVEASML